MDNVVDDEFMSDLNDVLINAESDFQYYPLKKVESELARLLFMNKRDSDEYKDVYNNNPLALMAIMKANGPRQVCQYQFKKNDIVWICRTCQRGITIITITYIIIIITIR